MDPAKHSLQEISDALISRRFSSVDLTEYTISQKESHTYANAYKCWDPKTGLAAAKEADNIYESGRESAPLQGIPVSVKDIFGHPDFPIFAGSYRELPSKWRRAGPIVQSLQRQSGVILGKTHTVEFAYGGLGFCSHWGTPQNPWSSDTQRVPGGSSSGAGISICQGTAFVALGTDTEGSVRIPASCTGVVGLKTSFGLWSMEGIIPLSQLLDTAGILTRTVRDATYAFYAISHPDDTISQHRNNIELINSLQSDHFRIGLADTGIMWECDDNIPDVCIDALKALEIAGCSIIPIDFPAAEKAIEMRDRGGTAASDLLKFLSSELPEWLNNLDPIVTECVKIDGDISALEIASRVQEIQKQRTEAQEIFKEYDVIAAPTLAMSPPVVDNVNSRKEYLPADLRILRNTSVGSYLDLCAISVPVGLDRFDMPVGLMLMAPAGMEHRILAIGQRLESIVPAPQLGV